MGPSGYLLEALSCMSVTSTFLSVFCWTLLHSLTWFCHNSRDDLGFREIRGPQTRSHSFGFAFATKRAPHATIISKHNCSLSFCEGTHFVLFLLFKGEPKEKAPCLGVPYSKSYPHRAMPVLGPVEVITEVDAKFCHGAFKRRAKRRRLARVRRTE